MILADYDPRVHINGSQFDDWVSFEVTSRLGQAESSFNIRLSRPLNVSDGTTVSIYSNLGTYGALSGGSFPLVYNKLVEVNTQDPFQTTLSGSGSKLTRKAPTISTIYINETWLRRVSPGYVYRNGLIYKENPGGSPLKVNGVSELRLMIEELPGMDVKDHEFTCILRNGLTHHQLGGIIAEKCGLDILANTPDLSVQKTFWLTADTPYWNSLISMFDIWRPHVFVRDDTVYIMDSGGDSQALPGVGDVSLTTDSFEGYQYNKTEEEDIVDHVIVRGPNVQYTYTAENKSVKNRRSNLPASACWGADIVEQYEVFDEYSSANDLDQTQWENQALQRPVRTVRTITKNRDLNDPSNVITRQEVVSQYNSNEDLISEITTNYEWASATRPIRQTVTEYARIVTVSGGYIRQIITPDGGGEAYYVESANSYSWSKVSEKEIMYEDYQDPYGQSEVRETHYGLCVFYRSKNKVSGTECYGYDLGRPIQQALRSGYFMLDEVSSGGEGWVTKWMLIETKVIRTDRSSSNILRKHTVHTTMLPYRVTKQHYEDIPLPDESLRLRSGKKPDQDQLIDNERRWEFFNVSGTTVEYTGVTLPAGDFHPKETISHPDIVTDANALAVAQRRFRGKQKKVTMSIKTLFPIPNLQVGGMLTLPSCTKQFFNYTTQRYEDITLTGGKYWINAVSTVCEFTGDGGTRGLIAHNIIELKDSF